MAWNGKDNRGCWADQMRVPLKEVQVWSTRRRCCEYGKEEEEEEQEKRQVEAMISRESGLEI